MRAVCCIGVAHNYFARRKYNLVELVRPEQEQEVEGDQVKVRPEQETGDKIRSEQEEETGEQINMEVKTKTEGCETNSEIADEVKVESSDVKSEDSENVAKRDSDNKVEGDSAEVADSKGTPTINVNGNCETANTEEKGTKD